MTEPEKRPLKEGDPCGQPGCDGIMIYWSAEVCPCNTEAVPCKQCAEIPLECVRCGYSEETENETPFSH